MSNQSISGREETNLYHNNNTSKEETKPSTVVPKIPVSGDDSNPIEGTLDNRKITSDKQDDKPLDHQALFHQSIDSDLRVIRIINYIINKKNIIDVKELNELTAKEGFCSLADFLLHLATRPSMLSELKCLAYKEILLSALKYCKPTDTKTLFGCYMSLLNISKALKNKKFIHFYKSKLDEIDIVASTKINFYLSIGLDISDHWDKVDFKNSMSIIKQTKTLITQKTKNLKYNKRQDRLSSVAKSFVTPPTFIAEIVINKFYRHIKDHDYIITDVAVFKNIIHSLVKEIFRKKHTKETIISNIMNALLLEGNQHFLKMLISTSDTSLYEETRFISNKYYYDQINPDYISELNTLYSNYNLTVDMKVMINNGIILLFMKLNKDVFYKCITLLDTLLKKKDSTQQADTTEDLSYIGHTESNKFIAMQKEAMPLFKKIQEIDSLEKLSSDEFMLFQNHILPYINTNAINEFTYDFLQEKIYMIRNINNILSVYCDIYKWDNPIAGCFLGALVDKDNPQLLLKKHIPLFKSIATRPNNPYINIAWFSAGEVAAYCLNIENKGINRQEVFEDAMNSYLQSAHLGNHRAYYKMAELVLQSPKGNTLESMQTAVVHYKNALSLVEDDDDYYSVIIELLEIEINDETVKLTQIANDKAKKRGKPQPKKKKEKIVFRVDSTIIEQQAAKSIPIGATASITSATDNSITEKQTAKPIPIGATASIASTTSTAPVKYTEDNHKEFWRDMHLYNEATQENDLDTTMLLLNKITTNPFLKHTSERWIKAMVIQHKVFFYYLMLEDSLTRDMDLTFLDGDSKKFKEITAEDIIEKTRNLIILGIKLLSIECSDVTLLKDEIDFSNLTINETRQLASLVSMRAHLYSFQSFNAKGIKKTKYIENYRILYQKADSINPRRLLKARQK